MGELAHDEQPLTMLDVELPREPACAAIARQVIREHVGDALDDQALERILLTASELVTNAWKHGEGRIELKLSHRGEAVRVDVLDEGRGASPAIRELDANQAGGWGLRIVDELAADWGCIEGVTHVWADVALD